MKDYLNRSLKRCGARDYIPAMDDTSNPLPATNKVIQEIVTRLESEDLKKEEFHKVKEGQLTGKKVIDIQEQKFIELLGTNDKDQTKLVMARITEMSKNTAIGQVLRGLGVQFSEICALALFNLQSRLVRTPQRFTNVELSAISTYSGQRAKDLLESPLPEEEPIWGKLSAHKQLATEGTLNKLD